MLDINNDYKFYRWLKFRHPKLYKELKQEFDKMGFTRHYIYQFIIWLEKRDYAKYIDLHNEFNNDENFNIVLQWEKGF